jgi:hypothetical protein
MAAPKTESPLHGLIASAVALLISAALLIVAARL